MTDLNGVAKAIASKVSGLRPEQVEIAVSEYRKAADGLHDEPEWFAIHHMCGRREAYAAYGAKGGETQVTMHVNSWKSKGDEWKQEVFFQVFGRTYESYGEARAAELTKLAKFKPHVVKP